MNSKINGYHEKKKIFFETVTFKTFVYFHTGTDLVQMCKLSVHVDSLAHFSSMTLWQIGNRLQFIELTTCSHFQPHHSFVAMN